MVVLLALHHSLWQHGGFVFPACQFVCTILLLAIDSQSLWNFLAVIQLHI